MKNDLPVPALAISYLGTITTIITEAKSFVGALAALASLIASIYAIKLTQQRLKRLRKNKPLRQRTKFRPLRFLRSLRCIPVLFLCLIAFTGCSIATPKRTRAAQAVAANNDAIVEESRALTTGTLDALNAAPENPPTNLARKLATADQAIEGLPLQRLPVTQALAGDTNAAAAIDARLLHIDKLRAENAQLTAKLRERESALIELGNKYEAEHNKRIIRRIWEWLIATFGIGGLIALCFLFPPAIPILAGIFSWLHRAYSFILTEIHTLTVRKQTA